jgi:hypothetical protein
VFIASRLSFELKRGVSPHFVYLPNGAEIAESSIIRNDESRMFLRRLGIVEEQITFLGSEFNTSGWRPREISREMLRGPCRKVARNVVRLNLCSSMGRRPIKIMMLPFSSGWRWPNILASRTTSRNSLPFQITLQEFAHRDLRGLDERERLVTKDGPPTVQQLPISQNCVKVMRSILSPAFQIELACLIAVEDPSPAVAIVSASPKLLQMRLPPAATRSLTD